MKEVEREEEEIRTERNSHLAGGGVHRPLRIQPGLRGFLGGTAGNCE